MHKGMKLVIGLCFLYQTLPLAMAEELTAAQLDAQQSNINRLNNRSIEVLNTHALVRKQRELLLGQGQESGYSDGDSNPTIAESVIGFLTMSDDFVTRLNVIYNLLGTDGALVYDNREAIQESLGQALDEFWKLQNTRREILERIQISRAALNRVAIFPPEYVGQEYAEHITSLNSQRNNLEGALADIESRVISSDDIGQMGSLLIAVQETLDDIILRETLLLPELTAELNNVLANLESYPQIEAELEALRRLRYQIESIEITYGYRFLALDKFDEFKSVKTELLDWVQASGFPDEARSYAVESAASIEAYLNGRFEIWRNQSSDAQSLMGLLRDVKDLAILCHTVGGVSDRYDCQKVRTFQLLPDDTASLGEWFNAQSTLYPELEKQLRSVYLKREYH